MAFFEVSCKYHCTSLLPSLYHGTYSTFSTKLGLKFWNLIIYPKQKSLQTPSVSHCSSSEPMQSEHPTVSDISTRPCTAYIHSLMHTCTQRASCVCEREHICAYRYMLLSLIFRFWIMHVFLMNCASQHMEFLWSYSQGSAQHRGRITNEAHGKAWRPERSPAVGRETKRIFNSAAVTAGRRGNAPALITFNLSSLTAQTALSEH